MRHRPWTEADKVELKNLAGSLSTKEIAARLGLTTGATVFQASNSNLSLSMLRRAISGSSAIDPGPAGFGEFDPAALETRHGRS